MALFPAIEVDDVKFYTLANESFFENAKNLLTDDPTEFKEYFNEYQLSELMTVLTQIQYTKYNHEQDLIYFDHSSDLHFGIKLHVYAVDGDGDKETLAGYLLILNSDFEVVDDMLS